MRYAPLESLANEIEKADIILVATNSTEPTILKKHLGGGSQKLIIDLSIPYNVEEAAQSLPNVRLVNVDELSRLKDETLKNREAEVPKAKAIIATLLAEFLDWHEMRKHVPLLKAVKLKLKELHTSPQFVTNTICPKENDAKIQRAVNEMALKIRLQKGGGCHYIEAIHNFITAGARQ